MRIWDLHPGYLNRQSLLGEHRELHGLASILRNGKRGYSKHPETLRWVGFEWALRQRHQLLAAEMTLRGYQDKTPLSEPANQGLWPTRYINTPYEQLGILREKYHDREEGRIRLPDSAQQLWSQHKYSVQARDIRLYESIGQGVATMKPRDNYSALALILVEQLRKAPTQGGIRNALQHMWGYIDQYSDWGADQINNASLDELLCEVQKGATLSEEPYLNHSTALSELAVWIS